MPAPRDAQRRPVDRVEDHQMMLAVMKEALRDALIRHKRLGNPITIWRDGRVVWLTADEIPVEGARPGERDGR
jgi:hypothetical protein